MPVVVPGAHKIRAEVGTQLVERSFRLPVQASAGCVSNVSGHQYQVGPNMVPQLIDQLRPSAVILLLLIKMKIADMGYAYDFHAYLPIPRLSLYLGGHVCHASALCPPVLGEGCPTPVRKQVSIRGIKSGSCRQG